MAQCAERLACGAGLLALRPMPGTARSGGSPDWDAFAGLPAGELGVRSWGRWGWFCTGRRHGRWGSICTDGRQAPCRCPSFPMLTFLLRRCLAVAGELPRLGVLHEPHGAVVRCVASRRPAPMVAQAPSPPAEPPAPHPLLLASTIPTRTPPRVGGPFRSAAIAFCHRLSACSRASPCFVPNKRYIPHNETCFNSNRLAVAPTSRLLCLQLH